MNKEPKLVNTKRDGEKSSRLMLLKVQSTGRCSVKEQGIFTYVYTYTPYVTMYSPIHLLLPFFDRMWKEKMRINEAERFGEISRKHQEQCRKWWDKLTPEQRKEKRKQYNLKWRQNQKKVDGDSSDSKEGDNWQSYKSYNQALSENTSASKPSTPLPAPEYYSKSNGGPVFNVMSGSVVYPFSYFPFRCQVQDPIHRGTTS